MIPEQGGRGWVRVAGAALAVFVLSHPVAAQYFGRQKVQYTDFHWEVTKTPHFQIYFYPAEREATEDMARMAERWYARYTGLFQHEFKDKPLIFYADQPDFQQTNVVSSFLSEGTGGLTEGLLDRVIMPYTGDYKDNDHVIGHELVHVFQYDMAQTAEGGLAGMNNLPLWLIEGMAEYLSLGRDDPNTAMWMRDAALRGQLPTIQQLTTDSRFFPYRYGQALWAFVAGRWGDRAVTELFRFASRAGWEAALQRVLGVSDKQLSQEWITSIRATYLPLIAGRERPQDAGDRVLYDPEAGAMNLSPAVSPDGQYVAFFGRHDVFTIDLYIADAHTGKIVKKLTSPGRDAHFDALSFINSAGTWSPDGNKLAFIVYENGDNELAITDVHSGDIERRIKLPGVSAILQAAWSPDGKTIAVAGMAGGLSNLYLLNLQSGAVEQLTDDRYAELQPAWSPDGQTLAFVTDKGGTDFNNLTYGKMQLALMDMTSHQTRVLHIFDGVKHINPQYSPNGDDLYFVSDRDGFNDVYRLHLASGEVFQITKLATGVSGITDLSPAISIAAHTGHLLFSVFENSGNNVYGIDLANRPGERVMGPGEQRAAAGILPPVQAAGTGIVATYLADPATGLPTDLAFDPKPYHAGLTLQYVAPPSVGVGVSSFGTGLAGGVGFFFSDMLGNQQLAAAVQANGTFKDIGGLAQYVNAANRWNWGGTVGRIPYLTGYQYLAVDTLNGQPTQAVVQELDRIYVTQAMLGTSYPFSTTKRFELNAGLVRYSFNRELDTYYTDGFGNVINVRRTTAPSPPALNLWQISPALVGDNSYFGFTSPVAGQRYRIEVSPTFGSLQYETVLADYRRYFFLNPLTIAFRAMHYGRYGKDSNSSQLSPLFLGWQTLIRGYDPNSFGAGECIPTSTDQCPAFDRLIGTRIAVANLELRIPLFGTDQFGLLNVPFLPTEIAPFLDAGVAWSAGQPPVWKFARNSSERVPVFSTGVSARFNILGYFVLEAFYAYPFQRPQKGGSFGLQLTPGW